MKNVEEHKVQVLGEFLVNKDVPEVVICVDFEVDRSQAENANSLVEEYLKKAGFNLEDLTPLDPPY